MPAAPAALPADLVPALTRAADALERLAGAGEKIAPHLGEFIFHLVNFRHAVSLLFLHSHIGLILLGHGEVRGLGWFGF